MLKQEWKSLFHNKILLLVVIVIALIPAIYAGLFLASMWDPYGNVDKLPVAIVNEDEPAEYGDTTLTVGDQLVDNLKENDSLAFNFVDADVAKEGLKMVLIIWQLPFRRISLPMRQRSWMISRKK